MPGFLLTQRRKAQSRTSDCNGSLHLHSKHFKQYGHSHPRSLHFIVYMQPGITTIYILGFQPFISGNEGENTDTQYISIYLSIREIKSQRRKYFCLTHLDVPFKIQNNYVQLTLEVPKKLSGPQRSYSLYRMQSFKQFGSGRKVMKTGQRRRSRPMHSRIFRRQRCFRERGFAGNQEVDINECLDHLVQLLTALHLSKTAPRFTACPWVPVPVRSGPWTSAHAFISYQSADNRLAQQIMLILRSVSSKVWGK